MLYYKILNNSSQSDWIVFIHGAGGSSAIWHKQIKFFKSHYNLLLVDLRGHGKSAKYKDKGKPYSFESIAEDIFEVLDHVGIEKAHFIGVSLGTLIVRQIAEMAPQRVSTMVLAGAISYFNLKSRFWVGLGRIFKNILPFMWLYRLFAFVIMPAKNHRESRITFINEAKKLCRREFVRWYSLTGQLRGLLRKLDAHENGVPTLYVMGEEDYMFLDPIKQVVQRFKNATLYVVEECGHVVNIEKPLVFNEVTLRFLKSTNPTL
jgi:pimeloyl-ACP methyl ester carboxylesterase